MSRSVLHVGTGTETIIIKEICFDGSTGVGIRPIGGNLYISGNASISDTLLSVGNVIVTGNFNLSGNIHGNSDSLLFTGISMLETDVIELGATGITGDLVITGDFSVDSELEAASANIVDLDVSGTITTSSFFADDITLTGNLDVGMSANFSSGNIDADSNASISGRSNLEELTAVNLSAGVTTAGIVDFTSVTDTNISGNASASSLSSNKLTATSVVLDSTLDVTNASNIGNLDVDSGLEAFSKLTITGNSVATGTVTVAGDTSGISVIAESINILRLVDISGDSNIAGNAAANFFVTGNTNISGALFAVFTQSDIGNITATNYSAGPVLANVGNLSVTTLTATGGDLDVSENLEITTSFTGSYSIISTGLISVTGNTSVFDDATASSLVSEGFGTGLNLFVTSNAEFTGLTLSGNIDTSQKSNVVSNVSASNIDITGAVQTTDINASSIFDVSGNINGGNLTFSGTDTLDSISVSSTISCLNFLAGNVSAVNVQANIDVRYTDLTVSGLSSGPDISATGTFAAGNMLLTGNADFSSGTLAVSGSANTLGGSGIVTVGPGTVSLGTLTVSGFVSVPSGTSTAGNVSSSATSYAITGEITGNSLTISGDISAANISASSANINSLLTAGVTDSTVLVTTDSNLLVTGNVTVHGVIAVTGLLTCSTIDVTGNISGAVTITVSEDTDVLNVSMGNSVTNDVTASGNLDTGDATLNILDGNAGMTITGSLTSSSGDVSPGNVTSAANLIAYELNANGAVSVSGNTSAVDMTCSSDLIMDGESQLVSSNAEAINIGIAKAYVASVKTFVNPIQVSEGLNLLEGSSFVSGNYAIKVAEPGMYELSTLNYINGNTTDNRYYYFGISRNAVLQTLAVHTPHTSYISGYIAGHSIYPQLLDANDEISLYATTNGSIGNVYSPDANLTTRLTVSLLRKMQDPIFIQYEADGTQTITDATEEIVELSVLDYDSCGAGASLTSNNEIYIPKDAYWDIGYYVLANTCGSTGSTSTFIEVIYPNLSTADLVMTKAQSGYSYETGLAFSEVFYLEKGTKIKTKVNWSANATITKARMHALEKKPGYGRASYAKIRYSGAYTGFVTIDAVEEVNLTTTEYTNGDITISGSSDYLTINRPGLYAVYVSGMLTESTGASFPKTVGLHVTINGVSECAQQISQTSSINYYYSARVIKYLTEGDEIKFAAKFDDTLPNQVGFSGNLYHHSPALTAILLAEFS